VHLLVFKAFCMKFKFILTCIYQNTALQQHAQKHKAQYKKLCCSLHKVNSFQALPVQIRQALHFLCNLLCGSASHVVRALNNTVQCDIKDVQ
jgi:hypothetical protein